MKNLSPFTRTSGTCQENHGFFQAREINEALLKEQQNYYEQSHRGHAEEINFYQVLRFAQHIIYYGATAI